MAQIDVFKRYLDAGMAFTELTEKKARAIVKDLVKTGEVQTKDASRRVEELVERSRKNTEGLRAIVQGEVQNQIKKLGLVPRKELDAVKKELATLKAKQKATVTEAKPATKKASAVKKTVKKSAPKQTATPSPSASTPAAPSTPSAPSAPSAPVTPGE